jgi:DNA-binding LacI/PurR family transcriptional regulator
MEIEAIRIGPFAPQTTSGAGAADAMINTGATAAIAYNDLLAIGMLHRFAARGLSVPDDVSIVGCDDIFGADFCNPPLTTMTAPIEQAGRAATTMLLGLLNPMTPGQVSPRGGERRVLLPTHLTIRASTGPVSPTPGTPRSNTQHRSSEEGPR